VVANSSWQAERTGGTPAVCGWQRIRVCQQLSDVPEAARSATSRTIDEEQTCYSATIARLSHETHRTRRQPVWSRTHCATDGLSLGQQCSPRCPPASSTSHAGPEILSTTDGAQRNKMNRRWGAGDPTTTADQCHLKRRLGWKYCDQTFRLTSCGVDGQQGGSQSNTGGFGFSVAAPEPRRLLFRGLGAEFDATLLLLVRRVYLLQASTRLTVSVTRGPFERDLLERVEWRLVLR
jgi:hypothetical protein